MAVLNRHTCQKTASSFRVHGARSLSKLWHQQGKRAAARELLAPIYGWLREGFDTANLQALHPTTYQRLATALLQTYRDDFGKYANRVKHLYLHKVFESAPRLVGKRFKYVQVDRELRSRELKEALELLVRAGTMFPIYATAGTGLPLAVHSKDTLFKILFLDVGLMQRACGLDATIATATDVLAIHAGAVGEQFVGQELLAYSSPYEDAALFFWFREKRGSQAEVDYLLSVDGTIIPLEVKAGKTGRLRSLKQFMEEYTPPLAVRISQAPLSLDEHVLSVPLYALGQLPALIRAAAAVG